MIVALGNIGDPVAIPVLEKLLNDGTPLLRRHAAWALGMVNIIKSHIALKVSLSLENDLVVKKEILYAMAND